jgi:hypothetical protein
VKESELQWRQGGSRIVNEAWDHSVQLRRPDSDRLYVATRWRNDEPWSGEPKTGPFAVDYLNDQKRWVDGTFWYGDDILGLMCVIEHYGFYPVENEPPLQPDPQPAAGDYE